MIMQAKITYDTTLFAASLVIAVVAATVACARVQPKRQSAALRQRNRHGIAVCGMHYTGCMRCGWSTRRKPSGDGISLSPSDMAYSVFAITAVLLTFC